MKNKVKKNHRWYYYIVLVLLIPVVSGYTSPPVLELTCPGLQVSVTSQSASSASFSWNPVSGASKYVVFYHREGDNYTSSEIYTTSTAISFSGLSSGTYDFHFATVCGSEISSFIIIEDLVL